MANAGKTKCAAIKSLIDTLEARREQLQQDWGDLVDSGVPVDSLRRQLNQLDKQIRDGSAQLYQCLHPPKNIPVGRRDPEPTRILDFAPSNPQGIGYPNAGLPSFDPHADWAGQRMQHTGSFPSLLHPDLWEWLPVVDPGSEYDVRPAVIAGTVVGADTSKKDIPFVHPFGFDWECAIVPDSPYYGLLSKGNTDPKGDFCYPIFLAHEAYGLQAPGVLGVETDQGLVPGMFQPLDGDRAVIFGRWIIDTGHEPFHTELHPPLLMTCARRRSSVCTTSSVISRPFLVSQEFGDGALVAHLMGQIAQVLTPFIPGLPFPGSDTVQARPVVLRAPFSGDHYMSFVVRPPTPKAHADDILAVDYEFVVRTGISVELFSNESKDDGAVRVWIRMNEKQFRQKLPSLPPKRSVTLSISDIDRLKPGFGTWIDLALVAYILDPIAPPDFLARIAADEVLSRGVETAAYDNLASPLSSPRSVEARELAGTKIYSVNDEQPFPIAGTLDVYWKRPLKVQQAQFCARLCVSLDDAEAKLRALKDQLRRSAFAVDQVLIIERRINTTENTIGELRAQIAALGCKCD